MSWECLKTTLTTFLSWKMFANLRFVVRKQSQKFAANFGYVKYYLSRACPHHVRRGAMRRDAGKKVTFFNFCDVTRRRGAMRREQNWDYLYLNCPRNADLLPTCCYESPVSCVKWRVQCEQQISHLTFGHLEKGKMFTHSGFNFILLKNIWHI